MKIEEEIQQSKFRNAVQRASLNIIFTGYWLEEEMNKALKPFGISQQQFNILRILRGQKGKPLNLFMIQNRMLHRMSNVTRLVEKLRKKDYVVREICPENRRMVEIAITPKGMQLLEEIEEVLKERGKIFERRLSNEEANMLSDLLDKLRG